MSDVNPYESPKGLPDETHVELSPASDIKQGFGLVTVLILTPLAVFLAGFVSCITLNRTIDPIGIRWGIISAIFLGSAICFLPPLAALVGMLIWARVTYLRERER